MKIFSRISIVILCIYFNLSNNADGIVTLPFKKEKIDLNGVSPEDIVFPKLFDNILLTELKLGTDIQTIPLRIELTRYLFYISGKNTTSKTKYDETKSSSFKPINEQPQSFNQDNLYTGYIASDYFDINDKKKQLTFILGTNVEDNSPGVIGLNLEDTVDHDIIPYNFINELKKNDLIKDYYFSFKYTNNEQGNLYIGDLPDKFDNKFKSEEYRDFYVDMSEDDFTWNMKLESIYISDNPDSNSKERIGGNTLGYFRLEKNTIEGTESYRQKLLSSFMSQKIKEGLCFEVSTNMYFTYYCKKDAEISQLKNLYFVNKELNYTFELTYEDLFMFNELDNNYYFLVVFDNEKDEDGGYINYLWILGEPFFKKYQFVFNKDTKRIGFYTGYFNDKNKNESWFSKNKWYVVLIVVLVFTLIGLGTLVILFIRNKPRKKKANELDEDFEYTPNTQTQKLFN